jgi:hypothetical protein
MAKRPGDDKDKESIKRPKLKMEQMKKVPNREDSSVFAVFLLRAVFKPTVFAVGWLKDSSKRKDSKEVD